MTQGGAETSDARAPGRPRKKNRSFTSYIQTLNKEVCPGFGMTADAAACLDNVAKIILAKVFAHTRELVYDTGKKTLDQLDLAHGFRLALAPPLFAAADAAALAAASTYKKAFGAPPAGKSSTRSEKAGLCMPVARFEKYMVDMLGVSRKTDSSAVYLTGAVEHVLRDLLAAAGAEAAAQKKHRLTQLHIARAVAAGPALAALFSDCIFVLDPKRYRGTRGKAAKKKGRAAAPQ